MWWNIIKEFEPTFSNTAVGYQLSSIMSEIYEVKQLVQNIPEVDLKEVYAKMKEWHELALQYDASWSDSNNEILPVAEIKSIEDKMDTLYDWFVELGDKHGSTKELFQSLAQLHDK